MVPQVSDLEEDYAPAGLTLKLVKNAVEAALICSGRPLPLDHLSLMFDETVGLDTLRAVLEELIDEYRGKGVEILCLQEGWSVRGRPELAERITRTQTVRVPKYSNAVLQVLAIIAYRQPVTRGDIEEVRGISVSGSILQQLEERGWIESIGHRSAPGNPALWATTGKFLDDLRLSSLDELPSIDLPAGPAPVLSSEVAETPQLALAEPEAPDEHGSAGSSPSEEPAASVEPASTEPHEAMQLPGGP